MTSTTYIARVGYSRRRTLCLARDGFFEELASLCVWLMRERQRWWWIGPLYAIN